MVAELREKLDLHRDLAVIGEELRARLNPESLTGWAEAKRVMPGVATRVAAIVLALAAVAAIVFYLATLTYWPLLIVLMIEVFFRRSLRRRADAVIEGISCNAEGLLLFADILQRLEREPFVSPRLQGFAAELKRDGQPASHFIRKLARIVYWIDAHHSLLGHLVRSATAVYRAGRVRRRILAAALWCSHARQRRDCGRDRSADFAGDVFLRASRRSLSGTRGIA